MKINGTDLVQLFEQALAKMPEAKLEEIGVVISVGDAFCKIHGLVHAVYGELILFDGGNEGVVMDLNPDYVAVFLLKQIPVDELEVARRSGGAFSVGVNRSVLGRVLNAVGKPIDGLGELTDVKQQPIEVPIPSIIERSPIDESLATGIMVIDALVPIGKGQRELIIGNRATGKTAIALDTILNQKNKNVICVYVAIGQRQANLARIVQLLDANGALEYTVVVSADAAEAALDRYLAPYVGCTIAEFFRDLGHDVLIVYDDLSSHAIAYREMTLLMRRPPGREAYPGDIFYLHSRLLERAGKLASGGSITALPIVTVQADDITAYIPTNLISITDGQIFLDTKLFNAGIRPAVNVELSVSRVGGAAQKKAIKKMTRALRLELAQYHELLAFSQFGTELDPISRKQLERGKIVYELLKQAQYTPYSFVDQALMLYLLRAQYLDRISLSEVAPFARQFSSYVEAVYADLYDTIKVSGDLSDETTTTLQRIADEFWQVFSQEG